MPQFGTSNRVSVGYIAESAWGVTPASPAFQTLRLTGEGLNYNAKFIASDELRSDRMTADSVKTSQQADGDISGELSYATYDDFLAAALMSTWVTTGTAKTGTDIGITKTTGTPNTWTLTSSATSFAGFAAVGQHVKVTGFATPGTFYGEIVSIAANAVVIKPDRDVPTTTSGSSRTVTPLNYARNGTTKSSFTIQKIFNDLATVVYNNYTGCRIGSMKLDLSTGAIAKLAFGIMAKDGQMTTSQFASATQVAANTNPVMNAVDNVQAAVFDGDPAGSTYYYNSFSLNLDNQLRAQEAIGTLGLIGVEAGRLKLTGSMELYFENKTQWDNFRNGTTVQLTTTFVDSAGRGYIVVLPRIKFGKMEVTAGGNDQDIMAKADFEVMMNTAGTYAIQISRIS